MEGAADFLVLPATHTFIMNRSDVAEQVAHFLVYGTFVREDEDDEDVPLPGEESSSPIGE